MGLRKIWIICGWFLFITGILLFLTMGLAWLGEAKISKILPAVIMGGLFVVSGRNFITRGKQLPLYAPAEDSEEAMRDRAQARLMIVQAVRIGGMIILTVALVVGLLIFFSGT